MATKAKRSTTIRGATPVVGAGQDGTKAAKRPRAKKTPSPNVPVPTATSIRSLITSGLMNGVPVKDIKAELQERFPDSMAAAKSAKHISYYKSVLKREHKLPKQVAAATETEE